MKNPFLLLLSFLCFSAQAQGNLPSQGSPNVVLIFMDDMGYGDIGCFGSTKNRTPVLDQMAKEGRRFTDFYVTSGVCTPSRSSLLTGCYPRRLNMHIDQNNKWVLFPNARKGLNPKETTVAELLKKKGYATTCIGKWHLGDQPEFLPTNHGFDSYFGIPYSNDNGPLHPTTRGIPSLPLYANEDIVELDPDQSQFTRRLTERAVAFSGQTVSDRARILVDQGGMTDELRHALRELDAQVNVRWPMQHLKTAGRYLAKQPSDTRATGGTNWPKYLPPKFQLRIAFPFLWTDAEREAWGTSS